MHPALVRAVSELGLTRRWMTPFFRLSSGLPRRRILEAFYAPFGASGLPVAVQLMGTDPALLAAGAASFAELGAVEVNVNFGCPSRQVNSRGAGGAALREPERMAEILTAIRAAVAPLPVSAKLRCGYAEEGELERILPLIAPCCDKLYFHYRTVREGYGPAPRRRERFQRALELAGGVPLILNGDVTAAESGLVLCRELGAAGLMAARGFLRDPGLLGRLAGEALPEAEELRYRLFAAVKPEQLRHGQRIELLRMMWR